MENASLDTPTGFQGNRRKVRGNDNNWLSNACVNNKKAELSHKDEREMRPTYGAVKNFQSP